MKNFQLSERVDVAKLDDAAIAQISSRLTRVLTQAVSQGAEAKGKFHIKFSFSKSGHTKIIIGDGPGDDGGEPVPGTPTAP